MAEPERNLGRTWSEPERWTRVRYPSAVPERAWNPSERGTRASVEPEWARNPRERGTRASAEPERARNPSERGNQVSAEPEQNLSKTLIHPGLPRSTQALLHPFLETWGTIPKPRAKCFSSFKNLEAPKSLWEPNKWNYFLFRQYMQMQPLSPS